MLLAREGHAKSGLLLLREGRHRCLEVCRLLLGKLFHQHGHSVLGLCGPMATEEFRNKRRTQAEEMTTGEYRCSTGSQLHIFYLVVRMLDCLWKTNKPNKREIFTFIDLLVAQDMTGSSGYGLH